MTGRPEYCYDLESLGPLDPCPYCGATPSGDDKVDGVCQARYPYQKPKPIARIVLTDRETGEVIK